jgi:heat-inducible transcriptional repressor
VVVAPVRDAGVKHVEFVALGADQALAVMVFEDGQVENRLMIRSAGMTPSALQEASNFLNGRLAGRTLAEAKAEMSGELDQARRDLNETAARLVEDGLAAWSGGEDADRALGQPAARPGGAGGSGTCADAVRRSRAEGTADRPLGRCA